MKWIKKLNNGKIISDGIERWSESEEIKGCLITIEEKQVEFKLEGEYKLYERKVMGPDGKSVVIGWRLKIIPKKESLEIAIFDQRENTILFEVKKNIMSSLAVKKYKVNRQQGIECEIDLTGSLKIKN